MFKQLVRRDIHVGENQNLRSIDIQRLQNEHSNFGRCSLAIIDNLLDRVEIAVGAAKVDDAIGYQRR